MWCQQFVAMHQSVMTVFVYFIWFVSLYIMNWKSSLNYCYLTNKCNLNIGIGIVEFTTMEKFSSSSQCYTSSPPPLLWLLMVCLPMRMSPHLPEAEHEGGMNVNKVRWIRSVKWQNKKQPSSHWISPGSSYTRAISLRSYIL